VRPGAKLNTTLTTNTDPNPNPYSNPNPNRHRRPVLTLMLGKSYYQSGGRTEREVYYQSGYVYI